MEAATRTERLIGTLRRECLDQLAIFGEAHLRRVLSAYSAYYNEARTHLALQKDAPLRRSVRRIGNVMAVPSSADCITNTGRYDFRKGQVRSDSVITMQIILFVMHDTAKPDNRN